MATRGDYSASSLSIELDGAPAGTLLSVQPAPVRIDQVTVPVGSSPRKKGGTVVSLGEMSAAFDLREPGPLLDWMTGFWRRKASTANGVVQVLDSNSKEKRRIGFTDAVLIEVALPRLLAAESKKSFGVALTWQPTRVDDLPGTGAAVKASISRRKAMLTSNFRVQGLPFDGTQVIDVGLPTSRVTLAQSDSRLPELRAVGFDGGELQLRMIGRSATAALEWVRKLISEDLLDASAVLALEVEILDAALKTVLVVIDLDGCSLLSCEQSPLESQNDSLASVTLRFSVAEIALTVPD